MYYSGNVSYYAKGTAEIQTRKLIERINKYGSNRKNPVFLSFWKYYYNKTKNS